MREFHEFISMDREQLLFYFTRIYTATREEFFVSVIRLHKVYTFDMHKDELDSWHIDSDVPDWLKHLEDELSKTVKKNLR